MTEILQKKGTRDLTRRIDLDWLRVFVILMLIPFHAAVMFDLGDDFFVRNGVHSIALANFTDSIGAWGMQLLFFVAGASSWFMLRKYDWKNFINRRVFRLFIPLIAAIVTFMPLMGYYAYRYHGGAALSFLQYYPKFFSIDAKDYSGYLGHLTPGHLWFILFLLVLLLLALPIFNWLKRDRGQQVANRIITFLGKPGALFIVPVIMLLFDGVPEVADRNVVSFFILLIFGFIWMSDSRLQEQIDRQKYAWLTLAIVLGILWTMLQAWGDQQIGFSAGTIVFDLLHDIYILAAILALLGIGHCFLNRPSRAIQYLGPASYPIYIIHLPIVMAIGYYVTQWDMAVWLKYAIITLISFPVVFAVYDVLMRRVPFIGRFFGAK